MLQDSWRTRLFIRTSIFLLRAVAPLSIGYCSVRLIAWQHVPSNAAIYVLDAYAGAEALFYLLVYIPRRHWLNRPALPRCPLPSREARREVFLKTWQCTPDPHAYVSLWFKTVPVEALCEEDIKDWLSWSLWNKTQRSLVDEHELHQYFTQTEEVLKHTFPKGDSGNSSSAVTFEPLHMQHRPLTWYALFVGGADAYTSLSLLVSGYRFYRPPYSRFLNSLPLRPLALLSRHSTPSSRLPYWYLPHRSPSHLPVLFVHGIGVGLYPYLSFLKALQQLHHTLGIGVIALEVLPISSRISPPFPFAEETRQQILAIFRRHSWSRCMIVSHSYGSVVCAHLLHDPETAALIGPLLFIDPVAFAFHDPHIAWNFLRRNPKTASEIQLQYFASMDPDVAHTLTRRFVWPENSLFREEIEERAEPDNRDKCTVALSGKDIIIDTEIVGKYLTRDRSNDEHVKWYEEQEEERMNEECKETEWTGEQPLEVMWFPDLNHAEVFYEKEDRTRLLDVVARYSADGAKGISEDQGDGRLL